MIGANEVKDTRLPASHKKQKSTSWGWNWCRRSSESSQDLKEYEIKRAQLVSAPTDPQTHACCACNHQQIPQNQKEYLYPQSTSNLNNIIELTSPVPLTQYPHQVSAPAISYQGPAQVGQWQRQMPNNNSQVVRYNYPQNDNRIEVNRSSTQYFQQANVSQTRIVASPQLIQRSVVVQQLPPQIVHPTQLIPQSQPQIQKVPEPQIIASIPQTSIIQSTQPIVAKKVQPNLQIVPQAPLIVVPIQVPANVPIPHQVIPQSQPQGSATSSQHKAQLHNHQPGQQYLQNIPVYQEETHQQYQEIPPQYPPQQNLDQQYPPQQYPGQQYPQQQYPPQYYAQQGDQQQYPPQYYEQNPQQMNPQSTLWHDRFFYLYDKFEIFFQKYDGVTKETGFLAQQFLHVDNEEEWLALKQKYDLLVERMNQMREENILILQEMQDNVQQNKKIQNSQSINEEAGRVWQHRYHELLEQYQSLSQHYAELQSGTNPQENAEDNERIAMMNEKYAQLQAEYNNVVQQLQNSSNTLQAKQENEDLLKYTQQLQGYIEQLESENNTLMKGMRNSVEGSKMIDHAQAGQKDNQRDPEIQNLTNIIIDLEDKLKQANNQLRPKSNLHKDDHTSQLQNQIHEMTIYCGEVEQKLSLKEYEINGMKDKIDYLKEQLQIKNQQIANNSKMLHQKLLKIQSDLSLKNNEIFSLSPPSPAPVTVRVLAPTPLQPSTNQYRLDEDYENRLQEYQKTIASKNNQIRSLEERISESESDLRKVNVQKNGFLRDWQQKISDLEDEFRGKISQKDSKIRDLEQQQQDLHNDNQRKVQQKDAVIQTCQLQVVKLKEEFEFKLLQKDITIKNLKQNGTRLENQIKQRNILLSQVRTNTKTLNLRTINQSYPVQNSKFDDGGKALGDQLQKKNDQIVKLKKERDNKNKQYKSLQEEYSTLQEENNKRRLEISNLRRQVSNLQNLAYEVDSLKANLAKRNQQIIDLKNGLTDSDKLRMQMDSKQRQIEKLSEISRYKSKDIDQLTERNYELQQKLRLKDFTINSSKNNEHQTQQNSNHEDLMSMKDDLRRKDIELSKYKLQNDQISKKLRRESEQLQTLKLKYPLKIKQLEDQCTDAKLTLAITEKKYSTVQVKYHELEETNKRIRNTLTQQFSTQNIKLKEYYLRFIQKLEDEIKLAKDRNRQYELQLQDYEQQIDTITNNHRQTEAAKADLQRRLKNITDKLDERESEMRILKGKQNGQINILRKKQARFMELQAEVKSKDLQVRELEKKVQGLKGSLKTLKNQYENYKNSVIDRMEASNNKEMESIGQQIVDYESRMSINHNLDFKLKNKRANQVFQRRVIYELKEEIQRLQRELDGRGINISLEKMKITAMQQQALMKSKHVLKKDDQSTSEQIRFYKDKNKELEERVNSHIAVNKNLRERLEYVLEENSKYQDTDKLKIRTTELENKINEYEERLQKLQDQNRNLQKELKSSGVSFVPQEIDLQMQESSRRMNQIILERNALQQQLSPIRVERDNLEQKCRALQKQLSVLANQNMIFQSEIERLNSQHMNQYRKGGNNSQSEGLRIELGKKETLLKLQTQKLKYISDQYEKLQIYLQKVEIELKQFKSKSFSPQYVNAYYRLQTEELERLKKMVADRQIMINELRKRVGQIQAECQYYKSQNGIPGDAFYYVELIRNNYVELELLASEIGRENQRMVLLADRIAQNVHRGLQSCQYLNEIISG